jgi:TRAP transporter TAXI family solute receptor
MSQSRQFRASLLIIGLASATLACAEKHEPQPSITTVRLAAGNREGSFYTLGDAMARAYEASIAQLDVEVQITGGAVDSMNAIEQGTADIGLSLANQSYAAVGGHLGPDAKPFRRLRGIAVLELTPVHLIAGPDTDIRGVRDLQGKRLSIIPNSSSSGTYLAAEVILKAHGLSLKHVRLNLHDYSASVAHLLAGTLDALFVTGAYPIERVSTAIRGGARLVPLADESIATAIEQFPFFRPVLIPKSTYPGTSSAVRTIGVETLLICRADLNDELVYNLTRSLFQIQSRITEETGLMQWVDLKHAGASPIPLHPGAARFYRERQLFR